MKFLETTTDSNMYAGTFGGMILTIFSNVLVEDLLRTVILAVVGATVSFIVSLVLKNLIRRKRN